MVTKGNWNYGSIKIRSSLYLATYEVRGRIQATASSFLKKQFCTQIFITNSLIGIDLEHLNKVISFPLLGKPPKINGNQ
jgi:hypothetical protein